MAALELLEGEKHALIKKVKDLEIANVVTETESLRKDSKLKEMGQKVEQMTAKLYAYKDRNKAEQKSVCQLIRSFGKILKKVEDCNRNLLDYITKMLQGLCLQTNNELPEFSLIDPKAEILSIFDKQTCTNFVKIDFKKLKASVMTDFTEAPNVKQAAELYQSTYRKLLARMETCKTSAQELNSLMSTFEAHKNLMKDNNALLRSNTMRSSMDMSMKGFHPDNSFLRSSFVFEDSIAGNESFRLGGTDLPMNYRQGDRRMSVLEDSVVENETLLILEESPRNRKNTSVDDQ
jgi:phage shock protein A